MKEINHFLFLLLSVIFFISFSKVEAFSMEEFFNYIGFTKNVNPVVNIKQDKIKVITLPVTEPNYTSQNKQTIDNFFNGESLKYENQQTSIIGTTSTNISTTTIKIVSTTTDTATNNLQQVLADLKNWINRNVGFSSNISSNNPNNTITNPSNNLANQPVNSLANGTGLQGTSNSNPSSSPQPSSGLNTATNPYTQQQSSQQNDPFAYNGPQPNDPFASANNGSISPGSENSAGVVSGNLRGSINQGNASTFAHSIMKEGCRADAGDQQNDQKSSSGIILSRSGVKAIPAVALPTGIGNNGDSVEVKELKTGKCKAFPLLDRGPSGCKLSGKCTYDGQPVVIDLTGSAADILLGNQPCSNVVGPPTNFKFSLGKVQYALVQGDKIQPGQTKECKYLK
jgi:hypothetical protein